jgi:NTP pyrophosphatase (non-canonical NTP hydrolase)
MEFNEYQKESIKSAFFTGDGLIYCTLGLSGEAGEFAEHIKKMLRDDNGILTEEKKKSLIGELGDVLWYSSALANELDTDLESVAQYNLEKIKSRKERGVQSGSGDNR